MCVHVSIVRAQVGTWSSLFFFSLFVYCCCCCCSWIKRIRYLHRSLICFPVISSCELNFFFILVFLFLSNHESIHHTHITLSRRKERDVLKSGSSSSSSSGSTSSMHITSTAILPAYEACRSEGKRCVVRHLKTSWTMLSNIKQKTKIKFPWWINRLLFYFGSNR